MVTLLALEEVKLLPVTEIEKAIACDEATRAEEDEDVTYDQEFEENQSLHERFSRNLYYGQRSSSSCRLSLPILDLCVDHFNRHNISDIEAKLDRFNLAKAGKVSRDTCTSPTSLVLALLYLERLRGLNPSYLTAVSPTELFLVSLMVASKYLHDDGEEDEVFNEDWAASAGMEKKELNKLEMEFLASIDWRLHATPEQFERMSSRLEVAVVGRQLALRRWANLTYSEVVVMNRRIAVAWELGMAIKVTAVIVTAYAASVLTMLGTCDLLNCLKLGPAAVSESVSTIVTSFESERNDYEMESGDEEIQSCLYNLSVCNGFVNATAPSHLELESDHRSLELAGGFFDTSQSFSTWKGGSKVIFDRQTVPIRPGLENEVLLSISTLLLS